VGEDTHPLVVELLTAVLDQLTAAGSAFGRAEARALHDDGLSQDAIAAGATSCGPGRRTV
jgi:hypothetical protein